ncbi:DciA family protein [Streptomyces sp. NPDC000229]|uniref:DciA family protein n=1 Tax=Streptomyces sp. NPDC000229 TaxID=3154247 RepID=UPI00332FF60F
MTDTAVPNRDVAAASGADLARIALHQAREAARQRGAQVRSPRRPQPVSMQQRDRRDPTGFATVLQSLIAERAWDVPASGGSILDQWPDIASAVAPNLAAHATAVAFDAPTGRLDLRPDSPAYGTQLRLFARTIIAAANERVGAAVVREVRVLPEGATTIPAPVPTADVRSEVPADAPVKTRENASAGYRRTLAVLLSTRTPPSSES